MPFLVFCSKKGRITWFSRNFSSAFPNRCLKPPLVPILSVSLSVSVSVSLGLSLSLSLCSLYFLVLLPHPLWSILPLVLSGWFLTWFSIWIICKSSLWERICYNFYHDINNLIDSGSDRVITKYFFLPPVLYSRESASVLLNSFIYFLDSTYKW